MVSFGGSLLLLLLLDTFVANEDVIGREDSIISVLETEGLIDENSKRRIRRNIHESNAFTEDELDIRDELDLGNENLTQEWLPRHGGADANPPYSGLIQVLSHTRSYLDGPLNGAYILKTADGISVSVDPVVHKFNKIRWAVYAGNRYKRCVPQSIFGNGWKAIMDCFSEGTYYAFFRVDATFSSENDTIETPEGIVPYRSQEEYRTMLDDKYFMTYVVYSLTPFEGYQNAILQNPNASESPWFYSDPFKVLGDSYCYRWNYRLIKENEVGFVHLDGNPFASAGIYVEYTLKVWICEPIEVEQEELYSQSRTHPSSYSKILTRRYQSGAVIPCIRFAHKAIEVTSDAEFVHDGDGDESSSTESRNSAKIHGPYWKFRIKVYMDRVISALKDIVFTIMPRQHSSLYECFIADVQVYIPSRKFSFVPKSVVKTNLINIKHSYVNEVRRRWITENTRNYYGMEIEYIGPPWINESVPPLPVLPNACINQELSVVWNGTVGMTIDFLARNDLQKIYLPSFDPLLMHLKAKNLELIDEEVQFERNYSHDYRLKIFDFAYTPMDIVFLFNDSSLLFHSTDLSLKGLGYNTLSKKYKLGSFVKRKWCANTATPKSHNLLIPAFSRDHGNFVVILRLPMEGARFIRRDPQSIACEPIRDTTKDGYVNLTNAQEFTPEKEVHADEADDARVDLIVEEKLKRGRRREKKDEFKRKEEERSRGTPVKESSVTTAKEKLRNELSDRKTFWLSGLTLLPLRDPHWSKDAAEVLSLRIRTSGFENYNFNLLYRVEQDFQRIRHNLEYNGLSFDIDEIIYIGSGNSTSDKIERSSPNNRLFSLHSVAFTGVEKRYLVVFGFQSLEFPKTIELINSTLVAVTTLLANDLSIVVNATITKDTDITLEDVEITFSGTLIRRLQHSYKKEDTGYSMTEDDFIDSQGRNITPPPLSKLTSEVHSINTALPFFILRLNDVILFASLDGNLAKPILTYETYPTPERDIIPKPYIPFRYFDIVITEEGIISALSRKEFGEDGNDASASEAYVGSVLGNEPLRHIHPFLLTQNIFQVTTHDGEIVYGELSFNETRNELEGPPKTRILDIPFWSLLKGSFGRSAGETKIPLDGYYHTEGGGDQTNYADPVCPFAVLEVFNIDLPYMESQYTTRITAEVAFYGTSIPVEADLIVEFAEVQGVSVEVSSFLEVHYDQTIIRKVVEVESFMPQSKLEEMYVKENVAGSGKEIPDPVSVFSLTIRPSILNLHCERKHYFKTIQINVGCSPFTRLRLIGEAVPVRKIKVYNVEDKLDTSRWYYEEMDGEAHLIVPKEQLHRGQRDSFKCTHRFCKVPVPPGVGIQDNVYGLSFRDVLVPKFEQFVTQHARRVTGNVIMYDILDSYKEKEFQVDTNITHYNAACLVDDDDWYATLAERANFKTEASHKRDVYEVFRSCFTTKSYNDKFERKLAKRDILSDKKYHVFNRTNLNALKLKRKRNYIYVMRAFVINTDYNGFTYCKRLDTFFVLQVDKMALQRKVLSEYTNYLNVIIPLAVFLIFLITYCWFAKKIEWTVSVDPPNSNFQETETNIVERLQREHSSKPTPDERLAIRIRDLDMLNHNREKNMYHTYKDPELDKRLRKLIKRSKSESDLNTLLPIELEKEELQSQENDQNLNDPDSKEEDTEIQVLVEPKYIPPPSDTKIYTDEIDLLHNDEEEKSRTKNRESVDDESNPKKNRESVDDESKRKKKSTSSSK